MNRKALLTALVSAGLGLVLLFLYQQRFEREASGGALVPILVAVQDINLGEPLTQEKLGQKLVPEAYLEDRHIRFSDLSKVIGVRVSMGLRANQSVFWSDLATGNEARRDLASLVRAGMRAITIRADATSSFGGLVRPGDRVDVLVTTQRGNIEADRVTLPLLQNILVLAANADTGGEANSARAQTPGATGAPPAQSQAQSRNPENMQVTLLTTPENASLLVFASDRGRLSLMLRNPDDVTVSDTLPDTTINDLMQARGRLNAPPPPPPPPTQGPQRIERIQGSTGTTGFY